MLRITTVLSPRSSRLLSLFIRFLLSGGFNTAITYLLYLLLLHFLPYPASYTLAFVMGIVIAYFLNRLFVFRENAGWRTIALFPLVYLIQYLAGLAVVLFWVEVFDWSASFAPLAAIAITIPLTFILSFWVFKRK